MRLDRFLANMGCGSRSEVKKFIRSGKVAVNQQIIKDEGFQVAESRDQVVYNGELVHYQQFIYLMLNKPAGVVSATEDPKERTVLDLLDFKDRRKDIFPVGRLDKDTEGLLLLTDDGELGHWLLAPKKHVPKRYFAKVDGEITAGDLQAFQEGILLDDGYRTLPAELRLLKNGDPNEVTVIIHEGKFHQIKRMFQALGKRVLYLKREAMGKLDLDPDLGPGEYRQLTAKEVAVLRDSI